MPLARWIEPQTLQARRESSPVRRKFESLRAASPLSQPSQSLFHTRHKGVPLRFAGDIEVVEGEVFDARLARSEPAQIARDYLPRRVAHPFGHVPGAAIGDDSEARATLVCADAVLKILVRRRTHNDMISECGQRQAVGRHGVIGEVTGDDLSKPFPRFGDRPVRALSQRLLYLPELRFHAIPA